MPTQAATAINGRQEAARLYQELEDRILARDQEGGSLREDPFVGLALKGSEKSHRNVGNGVSFT